MTSYFVGEFCGLALSFRERQAVQTVSIAALILVIFLHRWRWFRFRRCSKTVALIGSKGDVMTHCKGKYCTRFAIRLRRGKRTGMGMEMEIWIGAWIGMGIRMKIGKGAGTGMAVGIEKGAVGMGMGMGMETGMEMGMVLFEYEVICSITVISTEMFRTFFW